MTAVAGMLGIGTPETLLTWIRRSEVDAGARPGVTSQMAEENKALAAQGDAELRRANVIFSRCRELGRDQGVCVVDGATYWHMVDLLWSLVVIFALLYVMR